MINFYQNNKTHYPRLAFLDSSKAPKHVFRGNINAFINQRSHLTGIDHVEVFGNNLAEGVYDSSLELQAKTLEHFMALIHQKKIKILTMTGCKLTPDAGMIIGHALQTNKSLEALSVTSSQLQEKGMMAILTGLMSNHSLQVFLARSYNLQCYYWSKEEVELLAKVVATNTSLKKIILPYNRLPYHPSEYQSSINILSQPYHLIKHRNLATISEFEGIPDFCKENLDKLDNIKRALESEQTFNRKSF
ncbi:MAG TPA: hypothetical protein VHD33_07565 [Legionellaceae bacterium]|nr:hypothetical protein [Legionellaceae bacterium]